MPESDKTKMIAAINAAAPNSAAGAAADSDSVSTAAGSLPVFAPHLQNRVRHHSGQFSEDKVWDADRAAKGDGAFVLYWLHHAMRSHENPALDVAIDLACRWNLPLLVYQGLSERYQYASDRHHLFILQGAKDLQAALTARGIRYAFYLERKDELAASQTQQQHSSESESQSESQSQSDSESESESRAQSPAESEGRGRYPKPLLTLANQAAVVITEEMPVDPTRKFLQRLSEQSATPILCVDTACVVPLQLAGKAFTRAFEFRRKQQPHYAALTTESWPKEERVPPQFDLRRLPFAAMDLQQANLGQLIQSCQIDHAIGPVLDTSGGSTPGYQRWEAFKQSGLNAYARNRNDATRAGVSRMSAYLHYGMVSPLRLAREAASIGGDGAEKYLDELLIWREMAYAFCFYRHDHDTLAAIPDWARHSLQEHGTDRRTAIYDWETLARGCTDDPLWNAAQWSLLRQGELHNNVRMTWGKRFLDWTRTPDEALGMMIDLNHRYALDGRDPASYGGLLWCLGQFDRAFAPAQKIIGTVRPRPTTEHAQRIDLPKYTQRVSRPRFAPVPRVAVIGAGIAGLFAARTLQDHGLKVSVFEKSRGAGGRMSTRRTDELYFFDHGAQYFTVRDSRFATYVAAWQQQGVVAKWQQAASDSPTPETSTASASFVVLKAGSVQSESTPQDRYVGTPHMNSIGKHLAVDLNLQSETQITKVVAQGANFELLDRDGKTWGPFERVILAIPAEQAAGLLPDFPAMQGPLGAVTMEPCWSAMIVLPDALPVDYAGAFVHDSPLSWVARNSSKPGRDSKTESWVLHATPAWTLAHWEDEKESVAAQLLAEFWQATGLTPTTALFQQAHRWKYAIRQNSNSPGPAGGLYSDSQDTLIACGDWAMGGRVEGAFLSGMSAAGRILNSLTPIALPQREVQQQLF